MNVTKRIIEIVTDTKEMNNDDAAILKGYDANNLLKNVPVLFTSPGNL